MEDNLFVIVDDADNSIVLMNEQGVLLDKKGGEGRGPQEFQHIAQLHVGHNGQFYLLDMLSFRITVYNVVDRELIFIEAFPYKNPENYSLYRIYVTSSGKYGLFNETDGFQSPANRFLLYRLDKNFAPVEQLLEMPGHERQRLKNPEYTLYMPNFLLRQTLWGVDGEWLYYVSSYEPVINKYQLETGKSEKISDLPFPSEKLRHDYHIRFFKEFFSKKEYEEQWSIAEEQKRLPLFSGLWVHDDKIILRMFYPAEANGMMVIIDRLSEKVSYFKTPHELSQLTVRDGRIYGIDFNQDDYYRLLKINLAKR